MIELENYLNYCDTQYQNSNPCKCGDACTNDNYCQSRELHCYECIKRVHDYNNRKIHYNCSKMIYCYVLKHCYRFAAEIFYLFNKIKDDLKDWNDIYITSIGCGPCTELFGALYQWRQLFKADSDFHFRGFDIEPLWLPLMKHVSSFFQDADVHTFPEDVFDCYFSIPERIDVIVLNYMPSDMLKFHAGKYNGFLLMLCNLVKQIGPKYILVNDVYLKVSTIASNLLIDCLTQNELIQNCKKFSYKPLNPFIGDFGDKIERQKFIMSNQNIVDKYDPFRTVDSIQTIIKLK